MDGTAETQMFGSHLGGAQVGQVTFSHQIKGCADGSEDRDWSRKVQQRLQLRPLQRGPQRQEAKTPALRTEAASCHMTGVTCSSDFRVSNLP